MRNEKEARRLALLDIEYEMQRAQDNHDAVAYEQARRLYEWIKNGEGSK